MYSPRDSEADFDRWEDDGGRAGLQALTARFRQSSNLRASWQLANTMLPYAALWYLMYRLWPLAWWLMPPLAVLAAAFLVRLFIIFHDCGHGSFFSSRRANEVVGFIAGALTFVPARQWWAQHARHHAGAGNLDRRGSGEIRTLTVSEYLESPRWRRLSYRLTRNPLVLFLIAPLFLFVVLYRFPARGATPRQRRSVLWANLAILGVACSLASVMGITTYLAVQGLVLLVSATAGVWLFYVQHQFDGAYWERTGNWDAVRGALQGSSYYKLPRVLQWFSGNIGFHHIHHLNPGIPNYRLQRCHESTALFRQMKPLTLFSSLGCLRLRLWDEQSKRLVGYPAAEPSQGRQTVNSLP